MKTQEWLRSALEGKGLVAFVPEGAILPGKRSQFSTFGHGNRPVLSSSGIFHDLSASPQRGDHRPGGAQRGDFDRRRGFPGKVHAAKGSGIGDLQPYSGRRPGICGYRCQGRQDQGRRREVCGEGQHQSLYQEPSLASGHGAFHYANASGSTSQAANIMEALEIGARVLLIDEDTSATNFMIRDRRMQELVKKAHEPITPFIDKVRQLYRDQGVSTLLVMGGSGDYFLKRPIRSSG